MLFSSVTNSLLQWLHLQTRWGNVLHFLRYDIRFVLPKSLVGWGSDSLQHQYLFLQHKSFCFLRIKLSLCDLYVLRVLSSFPISISNFRRLRRIFISFVFMFFIILKLVLSTFFVVIILVGIAFPIILCINWWKHGRHKKTQNDLASFSYSSP